MINVKIREMAADFIMHFGVKMYSSKIGTVNRQKCKIKKMFYVHNCIMVNLKLKFNVAYCKFYAYTVLLSYTYNYTLLSSYYLLN